MQPLGVVGVITPLEQQHRLLICGKLAMAIAAGCNHRDQAQRDECAADRPAAGRPA